MRPAPSSMRLTGALTLRDGALQARSVAVEDGWISKGPFTEIDLTGYYVLPGIIDLHGDAFERHLAPRPNAPFPVGTALHGTDRECAANGVTTAWLAHGWSWEGGRRSPDHCEMFLDELARRRDSLLTDLRVQIRCETHTVETMERLVATVRRHAIDYVVFNDHIADTLAAGEVDHNRLVRWAQQSGRSPEQFLAFVRAAAAQKSQVPRYLCRLAEAFDTLGVTYGSHDDHDGETREFYAMIGAKVCEFPTRRSAAALAQAVGDPILMGAPNVVRGGSQSGNISATDLIRAGLCDALVSDYFYPALSQAAFQLVDEGVLDLPKAWAMISSRPAEILRLGDRGVIDYGRRADLTIVNAETRQVEATLCAGRITHLAGEAAHRFFTRPRSLQLAAE